MTGRTLILSGRPEVALRRDLAGRVADAVSTARSELEAHVDHLRLASQVGWLRDTGRLAEKDGANPTTAARAIVEWVRGWGHYGEPTIFDALDPTPEVDLRPADLLMAVGHVVLFARRAARGGPLLDVRTYALGGGAWIEVAHDGPAPRDPNGPAPQVLAPPDSGLVTVCEIVLGCGGRVILDTAAQYGVSLRAWLPAKACVS